VRTAHTFRTAALVLVSLLAVGAGATAQENMQATDVVAAFHAALEAGDGDAALALAWTRTTGTFGERQIDSNGVETMVLHRADGQWRIVHVHWSSRSNQR